MGIGQLNVLLSFDTLVQLINLMNQNEATSYWFCQYIQIWRAPFGHWGDNSALPVRTSNNYTPEDICRSQYLPGMIPLMLVLNRLLPAPCLSNKPENAGNGSNVVKCRGVSNVGSIFSFNSRLTASTREVSSLLKRYSRQAYDLVILSCEWGSSRPASMILCRML